MIALAGCTVDKHAIAPGTSGIQVAAVLNPSLAEQTVIVESIHSGQSAIDTVPFDPSNPIATGYGVPISNASVVVADTSGHSAAASEASPGVYQFALPIIPGRRYSLQVTTPSGVVTGTTTVPSGTPLATMPTDTFDVATSRLALSWNDVGRYVLAIQSPLGEYSTLLTDTTVMLTGALLDPEHELSAVFVPGFTQTITVSAIDSNYYNWVRPSIFSDASQRTRLHGGYGLFASMVVLTGRTVQTVEPPLGSPAVGAWVGQVPVASGMPANLTVYIAAVHRADTALSGNYRLQGDTISHGLLGRLSNDSLHLDLLPGWSALDTLARLDGTVAGATLTLHAGNRSGVYTH